MPFVVGSLRASDLLVLVLLGRRRQRLQLGRPRDRRWGRHRTRGLEPPGGPVTPFGPIASLGALAPLAPL
ncbi:MAG: hypothetical protein AAB290_00600, partial [Candidatus Eisenbacteria bacterium]